MDKFWRYSLVSVGEIKTEIKNKNIVMSAQKLVAQLVVEHRRRIRQRDIRCPVSANRSLCVSHL